MAMPTGASSKERRKRCSASPSTARMRRSASLSSSRSWASRRSAVTAPSSSEVSVAVMMKPWHESRVASGEPDKSGPKPCEVAQAAAAEITRLASAAPATRKRMAVSSRKGKIM